MTEAADQVCILVEVDIRLVDDLVASRIEYLGELKRWINCPWSRLERSKSQCRITKSEDGKAETLFSTERESSPLKQNHPTYHFSPSSILSLLLLTILSAYAWLLSDKPESGFIGVRCDWQPGLHVWVITLHLHGFLGILPSLI